jgi:hypothetical protein
MFYDTDDNRILSATVAVEQGEIVTGSFKVECNTGYVLAGAAVADVVCEVKHSAGAYVNIETTPISLTPWNGTTQTFNFRYTAAASATNKRRFLPLTIRRG